MSLRLDNDGLFHPNRHQESPVTMCPRPVANISQAVLAIAFAPLACQATERIVETVVFNDKRAPSGFQAYASAQLIIPTVRTGGVGPVGYSISLRKDSGRPLLVNERAVVAAVVAIEGVATDDVGAIQLPIAVRTDAPRFVLLTANKGYPVPRSSARLQCEIQSDTLVDLRRLSERLGSEHLDVTLRFSLRAMERVGREEALSWEHKIRVTFQQ